MSNEKNFDQLSINAIRTLAMDAIEQASTFGWAQFVGLRGAVVGMKTFGASSPLKALFHKFGFTVDSVVAVAKEQLAKSR